MIFGFWLNYPFNGVPTSLQLLCRERPFFSGVTLTVCNLYGNYKSSVLADAECAHNFYLAPIDVTSKNTGSCLK